MIDAKAQLLSFVADAEGVDRLLAPLGYHYQEGFRGSRRSDVWYKIVHAPWQPVYITVDIYYDVRARGALEDVDVWLHVEVMSMDMRPLGANYWNLKLPKQQAELEALLRAIEAYLEKVDRPEHLENMRRILQHQGLGESIVRRLLEKDDPHNFVSVVVLRNPSDPEVLVILRDGPPEEGKWAAPGGHVDEGEELEAAAKRELEEETGIQTERVQAFTRAPAKHDAGTVHFYFTIAPEELKPRAGDDAEKLKWVKVEGLGPLAFGCEEQIKEAAQRAFAVGTETRMKEGIADNLVNHLLEAEPPASPEEPLSGKWDKAHASFQKLWDLHQQRHDLFREMGSAIAYERALAHLGVRRADVSHIIRGNQVSATDNYRREVDARKCVQPYCRAGGRYYPVTTEVCPACQEPTVPAKRRVTPADLRMDTKVVGVQLNDGKRVFFKEPFELYTRPKGQSKATGKSMSGGSEGSGGIEGTEGTEGEG